MDFPHLKNAVVKKLKINNMEIKLNIETEGDFMEYDLKEYILYQLGVGACSMKNPFMGEYGDADIIDVDVL